jgi:enoyl-CoA hydratase
VTAFSGGASEGDMIGVTRQGNIALLTLARGKANTLDIEFCRAITGQFNALKKSPVEAVVLTAEGPIFSAGVDLLRASKMVSNIFASFCPC